MKVLFLVPYPLGKSPSQRFRFEQYFHILDQNGIEYHVQSFLGKSWKIFYQRGKNLRKLWLLLSGFARRTACLFTLHRYDFVFIHREAAPIGPPIFEWLIRKIFKIKIVYDFDDAIWLTDRANEPLYLKWIKWRSKVGNICSWSYKVSCGNSYLAEYASNYNRNCLINPTTVDTENLHNPKLYPDSTPSEGIVVGWTGSSSTLKYVEAFSDVLESILKQFPNVVLHIIADKRPGAVLSFATFIPWNSSTEIQDLKRFDIGIMPLPDDEWSKGKCGFKAIQYMAMEIPAIVSRVGVNEKIVDSGKNGFVVESASEWADALTQLIIDKNLRTQMGKVARDKIITNYSVISNHSLFLRLFA